MLFHGKRNNENYGKETKGENVFPDVYICNSNLKRVTAN